MGSTGSSEVKKVLYEWVAIEEDIVIAHGHTFADNQEAAKLEIIQVLLTDGEIETENLTKLDLRLKVF